MQSSAHSSPWEVGSAILGISQCLAACALVAAVLLLWDRHAGHRMMSGPRDSREDGREDCVGRTDVGHGVFRCRCEQNLLHLHPDFISFLKFRAVTLDQPQA